MSKLCRTNEEIKVKGLEGQSRLISSCSSSHGDVSYFFNFLLWPLPLILKPSAMSDFFVRSIQGSVARWFLSSMDDVAELLCIQPSAGALSHQQSRTQCHLVWWCSHSCFSSLLSRWCPTLCKQYGTISYLVSIQLIQCLWCSFHIYLTYILFFFIFLESFDVVTGGDFGPWLNCKLGGFLLSCQYLGSCICAWWRLLRP